eukprot:TCONS_00016718-protein
MHCYNMLSFVLLIVMVSNCWSIPIQSFSKKTHSTLKYPKESIDYLQRYGYIDKATVAAQTININDVDKFKSMLKFQNKMQIQATGTYNDQTRCFMTKPRCGEKDIIVDGANKIDSDFYMRKENLTYFVDTWSPLMNWRQQNYTIIAAFYSLRKNITSRIHLDWKRSLPDIQIRFVKDNMKSSNPQKTWLRLVKKSKSIYMYISSNETSSEYRLFQALKHGFGHILGMDHQPDSFMSPVMKHEQQDIKNCRNGFTNHFVPPVKPIKPVCGGDDKIKIKSAHNEPNEPDTYFLAGDRYWKVTSNDSYMQKHNLCSRTYEANRIAKNMRWQEQFLVDIDEGFKLPVDNWDTIFFKGSVFWRYEYGAWDGQAAKKISDYWIGIPDNIDTAFMSRRINNNEDILFFTKGDLIYKFEINLIKDANGIVQKYGKVKSDYPKKITAEFPRLPNDLDTAYTTYCDFRSFFFKDNHYWEWVDGTPVVKGPYEIRDLVNSFCM